MKNVELVSILDGRGQYAASGQLSITVTRVDKWSRDLMARLIRETWEVSAHAHMGGSLARFLGDVPGPLMRKTIAETMESIGHTPNQRTCLLTDSAMQRAAVTAYGFMTGSENRAFSPDDVDRGLAWLGETIDFDAAFVRAAVAEATHRLG